MAPAPLSPLAHPAVLSDETEDKKQSHDDGILADIKCKTPKLKPLPPPKSPDHAQIARTLACDECTIRMYYIEMDANANGVVTKDEFIKYLRSRPQLQHVMSSGLSQCKPGEDKEEPSGKPSPQSARAMGIKRIISVYKEMDENKNGVVTWDEFIGFFRRTGLLLTYMTADNPRDRMAAVLAQEYQRRQAVLRWQKGGAALGVGQKAGWSELIEKLGSNFLIAQKEQQVNTHWAAEKLKELQAQHARGKDALSIVTDSVDSFKAGARLRVGHSRSVKRHFDAVQFSSSESDVSNPLSVTPSTPHPHALRPQTPKQSSENQENVIEKNDSKNFSAKSPKVEASSNAVHLPALIQQPCENFVKSPMRRRKTRSPRKCGQTPRQQFLITSVV